MFFQNFENGDATQKMSKASSTFSVCIYIYIYTHTHTHTHTHTPFTQ